MPLLLLILWLSGKVIDIMNRGRFYDWIMNWVFDIIEG